MLSRSNEVKTGDLPRPIKRRQNHPGAMESCLVLAAFFFFQSLMHFANNIPRRQSVLQIMQKPPAENEAAFYFKHPKEPKIALGGGELCLCWSAS